MKKSLCETCKNWLVREWECYEEIETMTFHLSGCTLDNAYVEVVTSCNQCKKSITKTTYHDPEFSEYEKAICAEVNLDQGKGPQV